MATPLACTPSASLVLSNEELLTLICLEFLPWDPSVLSKEEAAEGRVQLGAIALVCKAFNNPALSCLWTHLTSLIPLIKLLPNARVVDGEYYFHGAPSADNAFHRHAQRVRVLEFNFLVRRPSTAVPKMSTHAITLLLAHLRGRPLFSGLRKLIVKGGSADAGEFGWLPLVVVSSVDDAVFSGSWVAKPVFTDCCLSLVREHGSLIRCLAITDQESLLEEDAVRRILEVVSQIAHLESLTIQLYVARPIQPRTLWETLHCMTNLKAIDYKVSCNSHSLHSPYPPVALEPTPDLPKLSRVVLYNCPGNSLCCCNPRFLLDKASAIWLSDWTPNPAPDLFVQLANDLSFLPSLVEINVAVSFVNEPSAILPFLTRLRPHRFTLMMGKLLDPHFDIADTIVREAYEQRSTMEPSELRELTLITLGSPPKGATLGSLARIAAHLPSLETLVITLGQGFESSSPSGLPIDEWLSQLRRCPPSGNKLHTLIIGDAAAKTPLPFRDVDTLAQILDHLFPSLQNIKPWGGPEISFWKERWTSIEQQRQMYQKIRMLTTLKP